MASRRQTKSSPAVMAEKQAPVSNRNVPKGIFKLARLHTLESFVCWYPAIWGACMSASQSTATILPATVFRLFFSVIVSITLSHCTFCTLNDIFDRKFDGHVMRTKTRPLPAGMLTVREAVAAFLVEFALTVWATHAMLGEIGVLTCAPLWSASFVYPLMKRVVMWPQMWLGPTIGGSVFIGWSAVAQTSTGWTEPAAWALFAAGSVWVVYFDTFYASQDAADDRKVGVKSLAVLLGDKIWAFLGLLGAIQVGLFSLSASQGKVSPIFWVMGISVWALNVPLHLKTLDLKVSQSGGKCFKMNILLGMWMTAVSVAELAVTKVGGSNVPIY